MSRERSSGGVGAEIPTRSAEEEILRPVSSPTQRFRPKIPQKDVCGDDDGTMEVATRVGPRRALPPLLSQGPGPSSGRGRASPRAAIHDARLVGPTPRGLVTPSPDTPIPQPSARDPRNGRGVSLNSRRDRTRGEVDQKPHSTAQPSSVGRGREWGSRVPKQTQRTVGRPGKLRCFLL